MKETQEFTGKDVDAAVKSACSALGISKGTLNYQVLSAGASGIFGIVGRRDAKIKVTLPDTETASAEELEGIKSIVDEAFGEDTRLETDIVPEKPKARQKPKPKTKPKAKATPRPKTKPKTEPKTDADPISEIDQAPEMEEDNGKWALEPEPQTAPPREDIPPPVDVTQESIDLGKEALQKMANLITDDALVEAETEEDRLTLKITGGNAGILIGRKG